MIRLKWVIYFTFYWRSIKDHFRWSKVYVFESFHTNLALLQLINNGKMFQTVSQYQKFLKRFKPNVTDNYISLVNTHLLIILKVRQLQLFVSYICSTFYCKRLFSFCAYFKCTKLLILLKEVKMFLLFKCHLKNILFVILFGVQILFVVKMYLEKST